MKIILASQSPRRKLYLEQLGVDFDVFPADIVEVPQIGELAKDFVLRMAEEKAKAVANKNVSNLPILASDTVIEFENNILGKPKDIDEFMAMFCSFSGRSHWVHSAVAILANDKTWRTVTSTKVTFCQFSVDEAVEYWNTGEPQDKAGGYGIQGIGAKFVDTISGSYTGVVGLPLAQTNALLKQVKQHLCELGD